MTIFSLVLLLYFKKTGKAENDADSIPMADCDEVHLSQNGTGGVGSLRAFSEEVEGLRKENRELEDIRRDYDDFKGKLHASADYFCNLAVH